MNATDWLPRAEGRDVCYLTTTGRTTGLPREIEIWFASESGRLFLLAGGRDRSHWVRNLRQDPIVTIRVGDARVVGRARVIEGEADDPRARELLDGKYHGWRPGRGLTEWARTALPVIVEFSS